MESKRKYIDKNSAEIYMTELKEIVNTIFNTDICKVVRNKSNVEGRMVFSKVLIGIGLSQITIGGFINKNRCSIIHYMKNFEIYFSDKSLRRKYEECRDAFFEKRPADTLYLERDKVSELKRKYARFKKILDIMNDRTPVGKEEDLEKKIIAFLNGL